MSETNEGAGVQGGVEGGSVVYEVPTGTKLATGKPSMLVLPNGRLLVAFDLTGPDAKNLPGKKAVDARSRWSQTKVFSSTDGGTKWESVASLGCRGGMLFRDGGDVYLLGEMNGAVVVSRSPDGGGSWSMPTEVAGSGGQGGFTPYFSAPVLCGETWVVLAWRGETSGWTALGAPRGASLTNRKLWRTGGTTGVLSGMPGTLAATGAGIPAGGVSVAFRAVSAGLVSLPAGHPWVPAELGGKAMLLALFSAATGREDVAAGMLLDPASLAFSSLGGAAAPWAWVGLPGGHSAFSILAPSGGTGGVLVAGNALKLLGGGTGPAWGRAALEDASRTRLVLWRAGTFPAFSQVATFCDEKVGVASGGGAAPAPAAEPGGGRHGRRARHGGTGPTVPPGSCAGIRRDPSLAAGGGQVWMVCRCGTAASRHAGDCQAIRLFKVAPGR